MGFMSMMYARKEKSFFVMLQTLVCKQFLVQSLHALFRDRLTGLQGEIPVRSKWFTKTVLPETSQVKYYFGEKAEKV